MSKHTHLNDAFIGMVTSITIGSWLFQLFSVFILAVVGALGGWIFAEFIKPQLQKLKPQIIKFFTRKHNKAQ